MYHDESRDKLINILQDSNKFIESISKLQNVITIQDFGNNEMSEDFVDVNLSSIYPLHSIEFIQQLHKLENTLVLKGGKVIYGILSKPLSQEYLVSHLNIKISDVLSKIRTLIINGFYLDSVKVDNESVLIQYVCDNPPKQSYFSKLFNNENLF